MAPRKTSTLNFAAACEKFVLSGINPKGLLPVIPPGAKIADTSQVQDSHIGKVPGSYSPRTGEWGGLYGDAVNVGFPADRQERAANWPTGNVGLLGRVFPAIDSDAESPAVRRLIHEAVAEEFGLDRVAERWRGNNDRRLYAMLALDPKDNFVRTRHVSLKLPGDNKPSKIDIIGKGNQYVIAGTHPSLDTYEWCPKRDLADPDCVRRLVKIDDADIDRFLARVEERVRELGGEWAGDDGTGNALYDERDPLDMKPTYKFAAIQRILDAVPNTEDNFPTLDSFVGFLAALRAASGWNANDPELEQAALEWATAEGWADEDYFYKRWNSLGRVRATANSLDRILTKKKIYIQTADHYEEDEAEQSEKIQEVKRAAKKERRGVLADIALRYIFRDVNSNTPGHDKIIMSSPWTGESAWPAFDWYMQKTTRRDPILQVLRTEYGPGKDDFWRFIQDLKEQHPNVWYMGEARNPYHDFGDLVEEETRNGNGVQFRLNTWSLSKTIQLAKGVDLTAAQAQADVETILEFGRRLFGEKLWQFELDTLAYMAQRNARPNGFLVLVGDQGVGKSLYTQLLIRMFNGRRPEQSGQIDGNKLTGDSARFALAGVEGCRIISIKEMPKGGGGRAHRGQTTAMLKQLADNGTDGDFISIERKGENITMIPNFARVVISTNYADSIEIEGEARRVFMVESAINVGNCPPKSYYAAIGKIIENEHRLAAFYKYLLSHDIGEFDGFTDPPSSRLKAERMCQNIQNPVERHAFAALSWFDKSGVEMFLPSDLFEIMEDCAEAEYENSGRQEDHRRAYRKDFGVKGFNPEFGAVIRKYMDKMVVKSERRVSSSKGDGSKLAAPYFLKHAKAAKDEFERMSSQEAREYIASQRDLPLGEHPFESYRTGRD